MTLVMLAHHFLVRLQSRVKKTASTDTAPSSTVDCYCVSFGSLLPRRTPGCATVSPTTKLGYLSLYRQRRLRRLNEPEQVSL